MREKSPEKAVLRAFFTPKCLPKWPIFLAGAAGRWS